MVIACILEKFVYEQVYESEVDFTKPLAWPLGALCSEGKNKYTVWLAV